MVIIQIPQFLKDGIPFSALVPPEKAPIKGELIDILHDKATKIKDDHYILTPGELNQEQKAEVKELLKGRKVLYLGSREDTGYDSIITPKDLYKIWEDIEDYTLKAYDKHPDIILMDCGKLSYLFQYFFFLDKSNITTIDYTLINE